MSFTLHTTCRVCPGSAPLEPVLDLGWLAPSAFPDPGASLPGLTPMRLMLCPECLLVQLEFTTDPEALFRQYWYRSGVNETMVAELADIAASASARVPIDSMSVVVDIGANDGTLLRQYTRGTTTPYSIAYEPSRNFREDLAEAADVVVEDFFPPVTVPADWAGHVDHLHTIAMFYDLDDPNRFVHTAAELLHPRGIWTIQFQDLAGMLDATAFDNIVHEHLEYYTLGSLRRLLAHNGLVVHDVEHRAINGGSLRCYVGHREAPWATVRGETRVAQQIIDEEQAGLTDAIALEGRFLRFRHRIRRARDQIAALIDARQQLGPIDGYGASTKGNTLLQVFGLGPGNIRQIAERSPAKVGKVTVTGIPIVSEEAWRVDPAPLTLSLIWQFRQHTLRREAAYLQQGGAFLFPLPEPNIDCAMPALRQS